MASVNFKLPPDHASPTFAHISASRRELFDQIERHALQLLPVEPYVFAEWRCRKVGLDYHVEIDPHYYSVPHTLLKAEVWARITSRTVEIFYEDQRVASHARTSGNRKHTTVMDHMPPHHRAYADWTPERLCRWAAKVGPNTAALVEVIMRERKHRVQGFRACLGILRLSKGYPATEFEAAVEYALAIGAHSYSSLQSILKSEPLRRHVFETNGEQISPSSLPARRGTGDYPSEHTSHQRCATSNWPASGGTPTISTEKGYICSIIQPTTNCASSSWTAWPTARPLSAIGPRTMDEHRTAIAGQRH